jgi:hypothetical protein
MHIDTARFTRLRETLEGVLDPHALPRLAPLLSAPGGEVRYRLAGSERRDAAGGVRKQLKCIICGWFFLADPHSLAPVRHEFELVSRLVLVDREEDLPPLEAERDDEDFIVCSGRLDVGEFIEEEILLDLPLAAAAPGAKASRPSKETHGRDHGAAAARISPFAKLAELKKRNGNGI